uniref:Uncharacterized protein n=1 Tax=Parascaris univalens TaxID=6257 RepID=A0A915BGD8_PARUN
MKLAAAERDCSKHFTTLHTPFALPSSLERLRIVDNVTCLTKHLLK